MTRARRRSAETFGGWPSNGPSEFASPSESGSERGRYWASMPALSPRGEKSASRRTCPERSVATVCHGKVSTKTSGPSFTFAAVAVGDLRRSWWRRSERCPSPVPGRNPGPSARAAFVAPPGARARPAAKAPANAATKDERRQERAVPRRRACGSSELRRARPPAPAPWRSSSGPGSDSRASRIDRSRSDMFGLQIGAELLERPAQPGGDCADRQLEEPGDLGRRSSRASNGARRSAACPAARRATARTISSSDFRGLHGRNALLGRSEPPLAAELVDPEIDGDAVEPGSERPRRYRSARATRRRARTPPEPRRSRAPGSWSRRRPPSTDRRQCRRKSSSTASGSPR